jgi:hypothetical protein
MALNAFVPPLLMAFTCTPGDRPCVASKRFEMNWNSAMVSRLNRVPPPPVLDGIVAHVGCPVPRCQQGERRPSTAGDRKLLHLPRVDVAGHLRRGELDERRFARHRDGFLQARHGHFHVDRRLLAEEEVDARARDRGKAGELRRDPQGSGAGDDSIRPLPVAHAHKGVARCFMNCGDRDTWQHGARRVGHSAGHGCLLSGAGNRQHHECADDDEPSDRVRMHRSLLLRKTSSTGRKRDRGIQKR